MGYSRCLWGSCRNNSNNRPQNVTFVPFPKPWIDKTRCLKWMQLCGLGKKGFDITEIDYNTRICDIHFVGGKGPTPLNPDPFSSELDPQQIEKLTSARASTSSGRLRIPTSKCLESSTSKTLPKGTKNSKVGRKTIKRNLSPPPLDLPLLSETSITIASVDSICPTDFLETSIKLEVDECDQLSNEDVDSIDIKHEPLYNVDEESNEQIPEYYCSPTIDNSSHRLSNLDSVEEHSWNMLECENPQFKEVSICKRKRPMDNMCDVPTCRKKCNHNLGISLHNVPLPNRGLVTFTNKEGKVETMDCRKAWLKLTQIDLDFENGEPGRQGKICSFHFMSSDFIPGGPKRRLRNNVLPSQNLPQKTEVSASTLLTDTQIMEMERVVREGKGRTLSTTQMTDSSGQLMRMFASSETSKTSCSPSTTITKLPTKPFILKGNMSPAPVNKLCRMCAAASGDMIPIFSEEGHKINLLEKMKQHVNLVVDNINDGLPKQICASCSIKLDEYHEMVQNCERVDILLRSLLRQEREKVKETEAKLENQILSSASAKTKKISSAPPDSEPALKKQKIKDTSLIPMKVSDTKHSNLEETTIPEPTLNCRFCETRFFTKRTLRSHYIDDHRAYLCPHCDLYFESHTQLKEHDYFSHFMKCPYCETRFRKDELVNHMKLHNALPVYVKLRKYAHEKICCKICTSTAGDRSVAKNHYFREHLLYACEICLELFTTSEEQTLHTDEVHMIPCGYCDEKNYTYHRYKRHVNKDHKIQSVENMTIPKTPLQIYDCKFCNKGLTSKEFVRRHNFWSHFQYTCSICLESFRTAELEQQHFRIHRNICLVCEEQFINNKQLKEHIISTHSDYRPYSCENCGNKYSDRKELNKHRLEHEQAKTHLCDECGKNFKSHNILVQHRYTHQSEEEKGKYNCNFCGKKYVFMSQLKVHMVKHTREKSFQCKDCTKTFSTSNALQHHMNIHLKNGEMKFECEMCKCSFQSNKLHNEHVNDVHIQRWIYKCNVCSESCPTVKEINSHVNFHQEDELNGLEYLFEQVPGLECDFCNKLFNNKFLLKSHITSKHIKTGMKLIRSFVNFTV